MLDIADLSLRKLIDWLMTPARSGVYLSADDLARIGENLGLRVVAMSRRSAMEQLFRAAALDESVDELFALLAVELHQQRSVYTSLDLVAMEEWVERLDRAISTLDTLRSEWQVHAQNIET